MAADGFAEQSNEARKTFVQLKPVCVDALRSLSVESLARLDEALRRLHAQLPPPLLEYVLFPLRTGIRRLGGLDKVLLDKLLSTLHLALSRVAPGQASLSRDTFQELFVFLSMLLDGRMSEGAGFGAPTEERSLGALKSLRAVLHSASESSLLQLFQSLPAIGHCVSVLVASLGAWEAREVRSWALTCLLALTGLRERDIASFTGQKGDTQDTADSLRDLLSVVGREGGSEAARDDGGRGYRGEALASFLPGVTLTIAKLLTTTTNLGQGVSNLCLQVWARYVCLAMNDRFLASCSEAERREDDLSRALKMAAANREKRENEMSTSPSTPPLSSSPSEEGHAPLRVERSSAWRAETDARLRVLAGRMVGVMVAGDGWRGRRGLVVWAHCLLGNCHRSLVAVTPVLLEALLTMSHDSYQQVSTPALLSLELFSSQYATEVGGELVSVLEERLYSLASSLPRLMRQHDDVRKVSVLQLLAGYLKLLGPHTLTLTHSPSHLSRLTQALVQTLELESGPSQLQELQGSLTDPPELGDISAPRGAGDTSAPRGVGGRDHSGDPEEEEWWTISLRFKHFRLPQIEALIQHCCQLLGFLGSLPALLDHLLDLCHAPSGRSSELLVVIGHVLLGAGGRGCVLGREPPPHAVSEGERCALVQCVLEEVTGEGWGGCEEGEGERRGREAVLLQCLQLEVVAVCARLLGDAFSAHLEGVAYKLLARAGSPNREVSSHALGTMRTVATSTGHWCVGDLIAASADYLVNSVSLMLRGHTHKHEALQVLSAILEHGSEEVLPLIRDSLDELLLCLDLQLLDNEGVWSVLRSLAAALHKWSLRNEITAGDSEDVCCRGDDSGNVDDEYVVRYFKECCDDHRRQRVTEEADVQEEREREEGEGETGEQVTQQVLTPLEQAAVDVLQRCPHFLPSPSPSPSPSLSLPPSVSLSVLDCLSHCLNALRHNQQTLLPQVHKFWPTLALRLSDPSPPVALRALQILWVVAEVCGDFVRRRVVKGVWPILARSLTRLAGESRGAEVRVHGFSSTFKLQRKMLESAGVLPLRLQVTGADLETLVHACLPYLSSSQPRPLRETCQSSLTALIRADPDILWLLLHQLVPMATTAPPNPSLHPYKFAGLANTEEYADTVPELLKLTLFSP